MNGASPGGPPGGSGNSGPSGPPPGGPPGGHLPHWGPPPPPPGMDPPHHPHHHHRQPNSLEGGGGPPPPPPPGHPHLRLPHLRGPHPHLPPRGPFFIREIYKNGFLKRLPHNEKKSSALSKLLRSDRYWVVFSVHDDVLPFLELWNEPSEVNRESLNIRTPFS